MWASWFLRITRKPAVAAAAAAVNHQTVGAPLATSWLLGVGAADGELEGEGCPLGKASAVGASVGT